VSDRPKAVAVLDDLMFTVKIQDAAKRAGWDIVFVKTGEALRAQAASSPSFVIFDLNTRVLNPAEAARELKASESTASLPLIGYVSHVDVDAARSAKEAGFDRVMARSAFVTQLPDLFPPSA
jgi:CheY-like chemotaxis protein